MSLDKLLSFEELSSGRKRAVLKIGTGLLKKLTEEFTNRGFYWLLPVVLGKTTDPLWPDPGASIEKRIEIEIYGEKVRTMQSMIVHKQVLMAAGYEKIFILSPNIRIEKRERAYTGKHAYEFTQLDFEVAYGKREQIFGLVEDILVSTLEYLKREYKEEFEKLGIKLRIPEKPFKVYKRKELEEKYGEDWEDKISRESIDPVWVTDLPREFYDFEDIENKEWRNYDLILPDGYGEVLSGAEREYDYNKILYKMKRDGVNIENYKYLLELAREGKLIPSAGGGIGVERLLRWITKSDHIAQVQPFPRIPGYIGYL
ncbi:MAG: asparagine synthetase A [Nanopusillaceae archaeon]|jgi:asparaginyl-tRNA synthetase